MAEPMTQLAMAVHNQPGVYAVLVGSGLSTAAGIPTGWKVTLDLVKQLSRVEGAPEGVADPEAWYRKKFGGEPNYSVIVQKLAPSIGDRQALLRKYFEPTPEDLAANIKVPTRAHLALARLMRDGFVKVVLTTNFDRLMESALEREGVHPVVVRSPAELDAAPPLAHARNLVIKLHGDYTDARILNTEAELSKYKPKQAQFLKRVFDEFGLIVVGWSATYDPALRDAIRSAPSRRYSMFWAVWRGQATPEAKDLLNLRDGVVVPIEDADPFVEGTEQRVRAIQDGFQPDLTDRMVIRNLVKRYLVKEDQRIRLQDLVDDVARRTLAGLHDGNPMSGDDSSRGLLSRIKSYEARLDLAIEVMSHGCRWGHADQGRLWSEFLRNIGSEETPANGNSGLIHLRRYPALILYYAGALGSVAGSQWGTIHTLSETTLNFRHEKALSVPEAVYPYGTFYGIFSSLPGLERHYTPHSDQLHSFFSTRLGHLAVRKEDFDPLFDRTEFLLALVGADQERESRPGAGFGFIGQFGWRDGRSRSTVFQSLVSEVEQGGWREVLEAGLFGGAQDRVVTALGRIVELHNGARWI